MECHRARSVLHTGEACQICPALYYCTKSTSNKHISHCFSPQPPGFMISHRPVPAKNGSCSTSLTTKGTVEARAYSEGCQVVSGRPTSESEQRSHSLDIHWYLTKVIGTLFDHLRPYYIPVRAVTKHQACLVYLIYLICLVCLPCLPCLFRLLHSASERPTKQAKSAVRVLSHLQRARITPAQRHQQNCSYSVRIAKWHISNT